MRSTDLPVTIYLNQQIVLDLLAVFDDGFSHLSTIKTSTGESEVSKTGIGASIGISNVFALLGVSFSGERGKEKDFQAQTEISQEKVHTPTSLFAKLRSKLQEKELLHVIDTEEALNKLSSGEFVEFRAILRKNPLVDTIERFKKLAEMAKLFPDEGTPMPNPKQKGGKLTSSYDRFIQQLEGILTSLTQSKSIELIGELLDVPGVKSVITARLDFFNREDTSEIIDGEFRVLGKTTRILPRGSGQAINLLRKTPFSEFDRSLFDKFSAMLKDLETAGLYSCELTTEVKEPALLVIPIAIFT